MNWSSLFPYALIAVIILFGIGLYALITSKGFLRIAYGLVILFSAVNLLLLTLAIGSNDVPLIPNALTIVFSMFILVVSIVFLILGITLNRRLNQINESTILDFNFEIEGMKQSSSSIEESLITSKTIEYEAGAREV